MEIMQTTAKMQQSQTVTPRNSGAEMTKAAPVQEKPVQEKAEAINVQPRPSRAEYEKEMEQLVLELNRSLNPFNTSLRFGFDNSSEDFYVSVIDTKTNDMVRRFPVEEAQYLLPKMKEINGLLFDRTV
ncbi:MAG: flagellar protein FlaG [Campylobacterales bacterium]|nr:flagellar protein FlaG [Campylobacterales bacterium]